MENTDTNSIARADVTIIPTLVLRDYVSKSLLNKYQLLMENEQWIACENHLHKISAMTLTNCMDLIVLERLESKCDMMSSSEKACNYHWETVQLIVLVRAFGMKVNAVSFES